MLINLSKFLASNDISLKIDESYIIDDKDFVEETHLNGPVVFSGQFFKVEDSILLTGTLKYTCDEQCARCLKEYRNTVEANVEALVVKDLSEDDIDSEQLKIVEEDGCVNLDEAIKQTIYLSMPMKSICKEDCKGICPNCGVNLNIEECKCKKDLTDPRFEKLKDLLKD
jgi:uncharacterized protein